MSRRLHEGQCGGVAVRREVPHLCLPAALPHCRTAMIRIGIGYDSHRFAEGRPFILGGQRIAFEKGLQGHSDADAVAHAVTDAILGAAGAGDLGQLFPESDPKWKDADSLVLLRLARERINELGFHPVQADITIVCERPRLGVYKDAMAHAIAGELGIAPDAVGMKAKTNEGMGFVGRGEGVVVFAVAIVEAR